MALPESPLPNPESPSASWLARNRKFAILGAIVVVLGLVALATQIPRSNSDAPTNAQDQDLDTNSGSALSNRQTFQRFPATVIQDADSDGLSDSEEQRLGTSSELADTDGDGLTDREETEIYNSDPLRQDSDGDGIGDGQEVAAGYSPIGSEQIRNIEEAIQDLE